ncbi:hypothetical protein J9303_14065 [Bacillaceae bacterium Marseille-Q3522]|nr:hypothetical protein [Bacillaceae bacterium Marseille-Q3522]
MLEAFGPKAQFAFDPNGETAVRFSARSWTKKSGGRMPIGDKLKTSDHKVRFLTLWSVGLRPRAVSARSWTKKRRGDIF